MLIEKDFAVHSGRRARMLRSVPIPSPEAEPTPEVERDDTVVSLYGAWSVLSRMPRIWEQWGTDFQTKSS